MREVYDERGMQIEDLSLIVRALHQDVSRIDDRLRAVEKMVRELQTAEDEVREPVADIVVLPSANAGQPNVKV